MTCPSELVLDELLTHGTSPQVRAHVDGCSRCRERVAERHADAERFAPFAPEIWQRVSATGADPPLYRRWFARRWLAPLGLGAAVAALVLVARPRIADQVAAPDGYVGVKGAFALTVAARRGDRVFTTDAAHPARPGDELRFVLSGTGAAAFVAILSLDGRGELTLFYPSRPDADSLPLPAPGEALPGGIVLDDAPGPEQLFVVLSARPLAAGRVRAAVRAQVDGGQPAEAALATAGAHIFRHVVEKTR